MSKDRVKVKKGLGLINRRISAALPDSSDADAAGRLEQLCVAARREVSRERYRSGGELYAAIAKEFPGSAEAQFYIGYCGAWFTEINAEGLAAYAMSIRASLDKTLELLAQNNELGAKEAASGEIVTQLFRVNRVVFEKARRAWAADYDFDLLAGVRDSAALMLYLGDRLEAAFPDNRSICLEAARAWSYGLMLFNETKLNADESKIYTPKIHRYEPNYDPSSTPKRKSCPAWLRRGTKQQ